MYRVLKNYNLNHIQTYKIEDAVKEVEQLKLMREKLDCSKEYRTFMNNHKIENIPTLDSIAQFYLDNYDDLKSLTEDDVYCEDKSYQQYECKYYRRYHESYRTEYIAVHRREMYIHQSHPLWWVIFEQYM